MKKLYAILVLFLPLITQAQSLLSLSGGYSFANGENGGTPLTGWRIIGLYERVGEDPKIQHGISLGYISVTGRTTTTILTVTSTQDLSFSTVPVYYAPKFLFGNSEKFRPYMHLAIGGHFSALKLTTSLGTFSDNDIGFYGGFGGGFQLNLKNDLFMNAEYEVAWLSNSSYQDGFMNTASIGIGKKF